jgi:hypothetical protein
VKRHDNKRVAGGKNQTRGQDLLFLPGAFPIIQGMTLTSIPCVIPAQAGIQTDRQIPV